MPLKVEKFLSSRKVRSMKLDEMGAYLLLLMECWLDGGSLPSGEVKDILGVEGEDWARLKRVVVDKMFTTQDGRIHNQTLEEIYRDTISRSQKYSNAGSKGNEVRWAEHRQAIAGQSPGDSQATPAPVAEDKNKTRFKPPTIEEVAAYCRERGNAVDPQTFCDFYASKGWRVGNQSMKDWRACVRTWEKERGNHPAAVPGKRIEPGNDYDKKLGL
jgi:uncharacterized protein YdaU (DUF1376 family)